MYPCDRISKGKIHKVIESLMYNDVVDDITYMFITRYKKLFPL